MKRIVLVAYKSGKYDIEEALKRTGIDYDEIVYVFNSWLEQSLGEMKKRAKERLEEIGKVDELYIVGAGYIPAVLAIWDAVREENEKYKKIILLDYDTSRKRYRVRLVKESD